MKRHIQSFLADESGATSIEYALIAAAVCIGIVLVVHNIGDSVEQRFTAVKDGMDQQKR